jgi:hypothetical protein
MCRSTFSWPRHQLEVSGQHQYPLDRKLSGARADLDDVEERKFLTVPGFEVRIVGGPARSQPLYRLRYPGSCITFSYKYVIFACRSRCTRLVKGKFIIPCCVLNCNLYSSPSTIRMIKSRKM